MTNQSQTDSALASPSPTVHSPGTSGPPESAGVSRQGMTDQPIAQQILPAGTGAAPGRRRRWRRLIRYIPLIDRTLAAYYCARDAQTPLYARLALFGAIAYFIMPFDAIPDFIPVVAHLDDAAAMLLAIRLVQHRITPTHRERARLCLERWAG